MKLFRLRFILLGLLLLIYQVWCLTCGTEFDDEISSAYLAEIVIIGKFSQTLIPPVNHLYNYTISIRRSRDVLKGLDKLKKIDLISGRGSSLLTVGQFGQNSPEYCSAIIEKDVDYIFYLKDTRERSFFRLSAMPISEENKKAFKRAKKGVQKVTCKKDSCGVKIPEFDERRKMKDLSIEEGRKLDLNCRLKRKPVPNAVFMWLKDGEDINTLKIKGLRIKTNKKGSRLTIRKASKSDGGNYECIARNVGGEVKQQAVISILPSGTGTNPKPTKPDMKPVSIKFQETLELTCKVQVQSDTKTRFKWSKDGKELSHGDKNGEIVIKTKGDESVLRKLNTLLTDEGIYMCSARNSNGEEKQISNVTVTNGPKREVLCGPEDDGYCLNNGTCKMFVEIEKKFCVCPSDYRGQRCQTYSYDDVRRIAEGEEKLAQDRTFVIVGIISGILLFIGICVASYFLAKRRRDRFHRRRAEGRNRNIEDNIPQVYRPLIGCDDIDGLTKKMNGWLIHKEVQTIETCFIGTDKATLYINPLETYIRNEGGDRSSRPRKTAVSLEEDPRVRKSLTEYDNLSNEGRNELMNNRNNNHSERKIPNEKVGNDKARNGAPRDTLNNLSPKPNPIQKESEKPTGANPQVANIPSPKSVRPPALNLESDSEEEIAGDGKPLTPLHISEDEDNSDLFKKYKPKTKEEETAAEVAEIFKKCKVKATALKAFAPRKSNSKEHLPPSRSNDKNMSLPIPSTDTKMTVPINSPENNTAVSTSAETATPDKLSSPTPDKLSSESSSANDDSDCSSTTTEGCDSPNTAYANSLDISPPPSRAWNERGSPEHSNLPPPSQFNIFNPNNSKRPNPTEKGPRHFNERNERNERGERPRPREEPKDPMNIVRGSKFAANIKDKFSLRI